MKHIIFLNIDNCHEDYSYVIENLELLNDTEWLSRNNLQGFFNIGKNKQMVKRCEVSQIPSVRYFECPKGEIVQTETSALYSNVDIIKKYHDEVLKSSKNDERTNKTVLSELSSIFYLDENGTTYSAQMPLSIRAQIHERQRISTARFISAVKSGDTYFHIRIKFISESTYTICKSGMSDPKSNMELYKNTPLPVIYCRTDNRAENDSGIYDVKENLQNSWKEIEQLLPDKNKGLYKIGLRDIVPYFKSGYFIEESEYRLMFDNSNGELEDYIQFRTLTDGTKIPYIIVKCGNLLRGEHSLKRYFSAEKIEEIFNKHIDSRIRESIVIPAGKDQKDVCREFTKLFNQHKIERASSPKHEKRWEANPLRIICEGHLPIVSITVSPSPKQKYIKEVIERFCKSKYWLQNVEINCSNIPYINPNV